MENKLEQILVDVLEVKQGDINDDMSPVSVDTWDSMNNLKLITMIEGEFNIEFTMDEIGEMMNVGGIKQMLNKKCPA